MFNLDDIACLCEFMVRDHLYVEAYCYIQAIIDCYSKLLMVHGVGNTFKSAHKISKLLGMVTSVFSEVTLLSRILLKAVTALRLEFGVIIFKKDSYC